MSLEAFGLGVPDDLGGLGPDCPNCGSVMVMGHHVEVLCGIAEAAGTRDLLALSVICPDCGEVRRSEECEDFLGLASDAVEEPLGLAETVVDG